MQLIEIHRCMLKFSLNWNELKLDKSSKLMVIFRKKRRILCHLQEEEMNKISYGLCCILWTFWLIFGIMQDFQYEFKITTRNLEVAIRTGTCHIDWVENETISWLLKYCQHIGLIISLCFGVVRFFPGCLTHSALCYLGCCARSKKPFKVYLYFLHSTLILKVIWSFD